MPDPLPLRFHRVRRDGGLVLVEPDPRRLAELGAKLGLVAAVGLGVGAMAWQVAELRLVGAGLAVVLLVLAAAGARALLPARLEVSSSGIAVVRRARGLASIPASSVGSAFLLRLETTRRGGRHVTWSSGVTLLDGSTVELLEEQHGFEAEALAVAIAETLRLAPPTRHPADARPTPQPRASAAGAFALAVGLAALAAALLWLRAAMLETGPDGGAFETGAPLVLAILCGLGALASAWRGVQAFGR